MVEAAVGSGLFEDESVLGRGDDAQDLGVSFGRIAEKALIFFHQAAAVGAVANLIFNRGDERAKISQLLFRPI